jgi:hypothetical protein
VFSYNRIHFAAACEQSKELALGKMLARCRWQKKGKRFGAAVDKIEEKRSPKILSGTATGNVLAGKHQPKF